MPARQGRPPKYLQVVFFMAIQYKRILLKVSGEALSGPKGTGFDEETIASICAGIKAAATSGADAPAAKWTAWTPTRSVCWPPL